MALPDTTPRQIGPYRVLAALGEGAMSVVYRAAGPDGAEVALKLLRGELLASAERAVSLVRFRREAEIGRRLIHPNVVRVLDHGDWLGSPYLVMELVSGHDLKERMETGGLPPEQAVALVAAVLDALAYAHGEGIVHRDIKPANIMIGADLRPKVTDFGIAQIPRSDITMPGDLLGTPAYMAPELLRGLPADHRSDLFSVGVMLYALLARRRPFGGSVASVMQQILYDDPPPLAAVAPSLPEGLGAVVMTALEKDPGRRHPSAAAFLAALDRVAAVPPDDATILDGTLATQMVSAGASGGGVLGVEGIAAALRGHLAALPAGPLTEKALAAIGRLLDAWFDAAVHATSAADRHGLRTAVVEDGVAPLVAAISAAMPVPGAAAGTARGDWMLLVRLLARLRTAAGLLGSGEAVAAPVDALVFDLQSALMLYTDRLNEHLLAADEPDLAALSADFLRLDVLLHALEVLEAERELRTARGTLVLFANQAMRKVNAILKDALDRVDAAVADAAVRFGVALVLARVEDLLSIAGRLLEGGDDTQRFRAVGQEVVVTFVGLARRLSTRIVEDLSNAATAGEDAQAFAGRLNALGALYAFATRLKGDAVTPALAALTQDLHAGLAALLAVVSAAPPTDRAATLRIVAIFDMAEALGWTEIRSAAVAVLRKRLLG